MKFKQFNVWFYLKNYKFNSMLIKNFRLIALVVILPLIGMYIAVYSYYNSAFEKEIISTNNSNLNRIEDISNMITRETNNFLSVLASDDHIRLFLPLYISKDKTAISSIIININDKINMYSINSDFINSIYVYSETNGYVLSNTSSNFINKFADNSWMTNYSLNKSNMDYWVESRTVKPNKNFLSFMRTIRQHTDVEGLVIVNVDLDKLDKLFNKSSESNNNFIIDKDNTILYSIDRALINKNIADVDSLKNLNLNNSYQFIKNNQTKYNQVVSIAESDATGWKYLSVMSLEKHEQTRQQLNYFIIFFMFLTFLLATGFTFYISVKLFSPIKSIISVIKNPEKWIYLYDMQSKRNSGELNYIVDNILKTFDSNLEMKQALEDRLVLLRKAQTIALQSQINPHFLFNTLETINLMSLKLNKGDNDISYMVTLLSDLIRLSFDTKEHLTEIDNEIAYAKIYLEIQMIRYKNKFKVIWDIDNNINRYKIPKITLQPVIENAIYHGLKPLETSGTITIRGKIEENKILITVEDDGVGMSEETVKNYNKSLTEEYIKENEHLGISNVNQRIKLIFGEQYGLAISSKQNVGTSITIYLPTYENTQNKN